MSTSMKLRMLAPALLVALAAGACENFLDVNENPNAPERARVELRVPALVTGFGHSVLYLGPTLWSAEWMQQFSYNRATRPYDEIHRYELQDGSANGAWTFYYAQILNEARLIMEETDPDSEAAYHGLAMFIWAWTWAHTTDMWGPVPFAEAFDAQVSAPRYDDQQVIYDQVHQWLEESIALMKRPSARQPGANDLLFGGDMDRWVKLARVIQARLHMRIAYAPWENPQQRAQAALTALQEGFTSNADDADFTYPGGLDGRNPLWMFQNHWRLFKTSETMLEEMLRPRDDPRLAIMVMPALTDLDEGDIVFRAHRNGQPAEPDSSISEVGRFLTDEDAPLTWASHADARFIEAEARLIVEGAAAADAPYRAGIQAHMQKLGVPDAEIVEYLAQRPNLAALANPLEEIIRQKYIANFLTIEPWNDWRRTGYPVLEVVDDAFMASIPVRIRTPALEADRNAASVAASGISTGLEGMLWTGNTVWWGGKPAQ